MNSHSPARVSGASGTARPMPIGATLAAMAILSVAIAIRPPASSAATAGIASPGSHVYSQGFPFRVCAGSAGDAYILSAVIDAANGYAYLGTSGSPGRVVKMSLGAGCLPPERVGAVTLQTYEGALGIALIDPANGYAYFRAGNDRFIKVALGQGAAPPTRVNVATIGPWCGGAAAIDAAHGYAYLESWFHDYDRKQLEKIALGSGDSPPARVAGVVLDKGYSGFLSGVMDAAGGHAYFCSSRGSVIKVALGDGDTAPACVNGVKPTPVGFSAVIDPANGFAYFGNAGQNPGQVFKVALGTGAAAPSLVGAAALRIGEENFQSAGIDPDNGYAYFVTQTFPGRVVKVALGDGLAAPERVSVADLGSYEDRPQCAVIDPGRGYLYCATLTNPGLLVKLALGLRDRLWACRTNVPEMAVVRDVRYYSHFSTGALRLAIYGDGATIKPLLWQSDALANTAANDWLIAPIAAGSPPSLELPPGAYWLAFQTDSTSSVASYVPGAAGTGLDMPADFAATPAAIAGDAVRLTPTNWSMCLTYDPPRFNVWRLW